MLTVILLALAAATSAAGSTVAKHQAASRPRPENRVARRLPGFLASMVANPLWLLGLVFDLGAIALQVLALRHGDLSVVQPVLTASLVIALALGHAVDRTRMRKTEIALCAALILGLVGFLAAAGSLGPQGEVSIGRKVPGIVLSVVAALLALGCAAVARRTSGAARARALAVVVAILYVAMAGFIKSTTRIAGLRGWSDALLSWQLWSLIACAIGAMVLQQVAYAAAPLAQSQPVVAALDPLFAVVLGVVVYAERVEHAPYDLLVEIPALALMLVGVIGLARVAAAAEEHAAAEAERQKATEGRADPT